jgi:hypothetical protein
MWFRPTGFLRLRDVSSVPVYSASSARRCRRSSWFERSADCAFLIWGRGVRIGVRFGRWTVALTCMVAC